ncbi:MAG: flagellar hook-length control protein FliK [Pseudomonadota bacterium]|nr:flagellar hook-length control protein FliK [Pseudomonadota bacterium]
MAIQQVASGGNNGIMSFLFQDDGSAAGTELEGAEFARTLRQLLNEDEAPADASLSSSDEPVSPEDGTALSDDLETLADDFKLPANGAELHTDTMFDGDDEAAQAAWSAMAFADKLAMTQAQASADAEAATETGDTALSNAAAHEHAASAEPAVHGVQILELAHNAEQVSLAQQVGMPAPQATAGRSTPASGKFLPQSFRSTANALSQSMAAAQTRGAQPAQKTDALPIGGSESAFSAAFSNNVIADIVGADARTSQGNTQTTPNFALGLQAARVDSALPSAAKAANEAAMTPQFDSPHVAGSDAWFDDIGARVEWLTEMNIEKAELQLHPAELGQLEIQIATGEDGTTVSFVTHNNDARALIEDNMPKLRELLAQQGLRLGDSQVSQHSDQQRDARDMHSMSANASNDTRNDDETPVRRTVYVRDPSRIDHYV